VSEIVVIVRYNAPLQPIHRGEFEDPAQDFLLEAGFGDITGGGTQMKEDGIEYAETEFMLRSRDHVQALITELEKAGAPKGSLLFDGDTTTSFGCMEGLGLHLNSTDLPAEVYDQSDANALVEMLSGVIGSAGRLLTYWSGQRKTSFYFYGPSFEAMRSAMAALIAEHPLCQQCRVEQVA
jgi:hypothetical protein